MGVRLPPEYQETEWIEGTRNLHLIDTGIPGNRNTLIIEAKVKPGDLVQYAPLWGNYRGENYNVTRLIAYASNSILSYINTKAGGGTSAVTILPLFGTGKTFVIRQERTRLIIDGTAYTIPASATASENNGNIAINASTTGNPAPGTYTTQRWYYFRIFDGEIILRDFIPCYRKSDMIAGMYDLVSNAFFANARTDKTSEFTAGPDVIDSISPWMVARRRMLMRKPLDTSPKIIAYDKRYVQGGSLQNSAGDCATEIYHYPVGTAVQNLYSYGTNYYTLVYKNNGTTYMDWWAMATYNAPGKWGVLNKGSDGVGITLKTDMLDVCYAYIVETGEILFAGKESIYYGHKNISELN